VRRHCAILIRPCYVAPADRTGRPHRLTVDDADEPDVVKPDEIHMSIREDDRPVLCFPLTKRATRKLIRQLNDALAKREGR
jgi:hypothetical protein